MLWIRWKKEGFDLELNSTYHFHATCESYFDYMKLHVIYKAQNLCVHFKPWKLNICECKEFAVCLYTNITKNKDIK